MQMGAEIAGLDEDLQRIEAQLMMAMKASVPLVTEDAKACLREHIEADVYAEWEPKEYVRRYEYGGLSDVEGNTLAYERDNGVKIDYRPDGDSPQWDNPASGDDLVRRIETGEGYEWNIHPGARPFFQDFIDDMVDGGRAERAFVTGINLAAPTLEVMADGNAQRDGTEYDS